MYSVKISLFINHKNYFRSILDHSVAKQLGRPVMRQHSRDITTRGINLKCVVFADQSLELSHRLHSTDEQPLKFALTQVNRVSRL